MANQIPASALIRIRGLRFRYPGQQQDVLRIPALDVFAGGGLTALTGPSGAGKSTLVEILAGTLREPYEGRVEVMGVDWASLTRDSERQRQIRRIGLIPQDFALLPGKTAWEVIDQDLSDSGVPKGERDSRIEQALAQVGMSGFEARDVNRLSGGQRQRVAIARMLARDVDLVIADEPTANLDPQLVDETLGLLRQLAAHAPVIVVTHDARVAALCDRTVVLQSAVVGPSEAESGTHARRTRRWLLPVAAVALVVLLASAAGFYLAKTHLLANPTPTPTPTATPRPPTPIPRNPGPTLTAIAQNTVAQIDSALRASNARWTASMECGCDNNLGSVKTGVNLASTLSQVQQMQASNEKWTVDLHSIHIDSVKLSDSSHADATVSKVETNAIFQNGSLIQTCDGPYVVRYHLKLDQGTWKVESTQVLGGGQSCQQAGTPTPTLGQAVQQDLAVIQQQGFDPSSENASTSDGNGGTLYAWVGVCHGSGDGHCQTIFFFDGTNFLGTDALHNSAQITGIQSVGPATIQAIYPTFLPNDPMCCPSGSPRTIDFSWDGTKLTPSQTP